MLAAAITAPSMMVPSNKRIDFFIMFSSRKKVTCTICGASYLIATISIDAKFPNRFSRENSIRRVRRSWPVGSRSEAIFVDRPSSGRPPNQRSKETAKRLSLKRDKLITIKLLDKFRPQLFRVLLRFESGDLLKPGGLESGALDR